MAASDHIVDVGGEEGEDEGAGGVDAAVEINGSDNGFHHVGKDGGALTSAGGAFAATEKEVVGEGQGDCLPMQSFFADDGGADAGEVAFGKLGEGAVEVVGADVAENGIAEEFQTFVGLRVRTAMPGEMLVCIGAVGQGVF